MELSAIRTLARPRLDGVTRTLFAVLGMAAILAGILAMHAAGAGGEHANTAAPMSAVSANATQQSAPETAAATSLIGAHCDEACLHGLMDCALMVMTCATLLIFAALALLADRPAIFRRLLDAGGRAVAIVQTFPLHLHRPSLAVLSISRT
ncbi:hypothetical protein M3147_13395 [Agromyces mediolanus]|uniref:hypothetical protein n=1 Tax=Agromyces mediolanus TaxID=41986 RepID=UPI00203D12DC|nr:hypothetical protein [Agromyces mediolanus]MCM3658243.1 hypothetical protein [Agromyces mediolanus]